DRPSPSLPQAIESRPRLMQAKVVVLFIATPRGDSIDRPGRPPSKARSQKPAGRKYSDRTFAAAASGGRCLAGKMSGGSQDPAEVFRERSWPRQVRRKVSGKTLVVIIITKKVFPKTFRRRTARRNGLSF